MLIGMTYDLRDRYLALGLDEQETAEFDSEETVAAIESGLRRLGHETERIGNLDDLVRALASGRHWDMVFNIAEGLYGFGREAQVPALLDGYGIPYTFSDPLVLSLTLHKGMTKRVLRDLGVPTPDFAMVGAEADLKSIALEYPLFAKPVAEGTGKGISALSRIENAAELRYVCLNLIAAFDQPVLVERFLPGREFTVGILGTGEAARVLGVMEVILGGEAEADAYSYENKQKWEERVSYRLAADPTALQAGETALRAWRGLGCRDAGRIDLRADARGRPHFIEVNPLAGLHPGHSDLPILCRLAGVTYGDLLRGIMDSVAERIPESASAARCTDVPEGRTAHGGAF
ncbi:conserved hypothetical protein [uncultured Desulfatiglans sp.]|nr:conserved hypothetical protein [uncultured Desulfatiglans sp.]